MMWYIDNPSRRRSEQQSLEALSASVPWLTPVGWRNDEAARLIWDADIHVSSETFPVFLRFPNHFPHSPPSVLPRGKEERWSIHQYGAGGELCLEYGPDNWHPGISAADMIASAYRLLHGERPSPEEARAVASRHDTSLGQNLRGKFSRFVVTQELKDTLDGIPEIAVLAAKAIGLFHGDTLVNIVSSITMPDGMVWSATLPAPLKHGYERPIAVFRWPSNNTAPPTSSLKTFIAAVEPSGTRLSAVLYALMVHGTRFRAYFLNSDDDTVSVVAVILPQVTAVRLDESHEALRTKTVAIVGCGSLGSKVATTLARSGVGRFLLVDDDIMLPDNVVRNDLDWRDVGMHKADAVAAKIQLVNATAVCTRRNHRLGGQEASGTVESLIETLAGCDLVIDATADPSVFNYLCAVVAVGQKPLLWAEVFGGGFGGLVARHRPSSDPDPASMRRGIESWCAERDKPVERPANRYGGGASAPAIANDADVGVIAAHASRMAIDTLARETASGFPHSVYIIGLSKGWIFNEPFETFPIDLGPPPDSASQEAVDRKDVAAEIQELVQLFKEHRDATYPSLAESEASSA